LEINLIAILRIRQGLLSPVELFRHCFHLVNVLPNIEWGRFVEKDLESIVTSHWRSVVENQRFALRLPNVMGPQIAAACDDQSSSGYPKTAKVLLAAVEAVGVRLPAAARGMLEQIAANHPIKVRRVEHAASDHAAADNRDPTMRLHAPALPIRAPRRPL
jgi:allophanate hydrolase subunit 2